jgi:hypothetical protein
MSTKFDARIYEEGGGRFSPVFLIPLLFQFHYAEVKGHDSSE